MAITYHVGAVAAVTLMTASFLPPRVARNQVMSPQRPPEIAMSR
jgi:hypothetical protein